MAKATMKDITEVVGTEVTLTMTKNEAEKLLTLLGKVGGGNLTNVYSALSLAGVDGDKYEVRTKRYLSESSFTQVEEKVSALTIKPKTIPAPQFKIDMGGVLGSYSRGYYPTAF